MQTYTPIARGVVIGGQSVRIACLPATGLTEVTADGRSVYIGYSADAAQAAFREAKDAAQAAKIRRQNNA